MASGHEKAACGVDPARGWGQPSRREAWATAVLALVLGTPFVFATIQGARRLLGW